MDQSDTPEPVPRKKKKKSRPVVAAPTGEATPPWVRVVGAISLVFIAVVGVYAIVQGFRDAVDENTNPKKVVQYADETIRASLPIGTTRPQVEAWLKAQKIKPQATDGRAGYRTIRAIGGGADFPAPARDAGINQEEVAAMIVVYFPQTGSGASKAAATLKVYFFFNGDNGLLGHWIDEQSLTAS